METDSSSGFGDDDQLDKSEHCRALQKVPKLEQYLPEKDTLQESRQFYLHKLKSNLNRAVLAQDESLSDWINAFNEFLNAFGFAFTKEEHILFVQICLKTLDSIEYDFIMMRKLSKLLYRLLRKTHLLSRKDLQLDWRIFLRLVERTYQSPHYQKKTLYLELGFYAELMKLVCYARVYFSTESTAQMFTEWKQYLCIYSNKFSKYVSYFSLFLPTLFYPEEHEFAFKLWFEDFMNMWISLPSTSNKIMQQNFIHLFSLLAHDTIGFINWDPYMPLIFERFMNYFHVDARKSDATLEIKLYTKWIVSMISPTSKCLDHLKQFFRLRSVNFFISSTKSDSLFRTMSASLLDHFIKRLRDERYKKNWHNFTPKTHILTEQVVHQFASIMVDGIEKIHFNEFDIENMYRLSLLSPDILSLKVIPKLELAYEQISEPARLVSALQMFSISLYPILTNRSTDPEFKSYLRPILTNLTNSINTNDHFLCFLQLFAIRSIVVLGIPLHDFSSLYESIDDLDEPTAQILLDSRQLEDFAIEFVNCCFTIIESGNEDLFKLNKKGQTMPNLLSDIFRYVLANTSPKNSKLMIDKLFSYATTRIFENEECCKILKKLLQACFMTNSEYSMNKFFVTISRNISLTIENKTSLKEICKSELIYNLHLLHACFAHNGTSLLKYQDQIVDLLSVILRVDFEDNFTLLTNLLTSLFSYLTRIYLLDKVFIASAHKNGSAQELKQLVNWPYQTDLKNLPLNWHIPTQEEITFAQRLFTTFIGAQMTLLESWLDSKVELSKWQLEKSLTIILSFHGFIYALPKFDGELYPQRSSNYLDEEVLSFQVTDDAHFREKLMQLMQKVHLRLDTMLDNVSLLIIVIQILDYLLFPYTNHTNTNSENAIKKIYQPLSNDHVYIPAVHYSRINVYHAKLMSILKSLRNSTFSPSHKVAMQMLVDLSTCSCSKVRKFAQVLFAKLFRKFPYSIDLIAPQLAANLKNIDNDSAFKGTLYLLIGNLSQSMLLSPNWNFVIQLWPILVKANFVEKPKIAKIFDFQFFPLISSYFSTIPFKRESISHNFKDLFQTSKIANFSVPSPQEVESINLAIQEWSKTSEASYRMLTGGMSLILTNDKLHWRFHNLGIYLLNLLVRYDSSPSREMVQIFLDNLVHDSIHIRKTAITGLRKILFLNRPAKEYVQLQYDSSAVQFTGVDYLLNKEAYQKMAFHDKNHSGYVCANYTGTKPGITKVDNQFIADQFRNQQFLYKLFDLYSVENSKTIDRDFVKIWKYLFQTFKLFNDDLIFTRIELLLAKDKHSFDKLAVEIMGGLVKASPWLDYADMCRAKVFLLNILSKHLANFNSESYELWCYLVNTFFTNRDIRRSLWVLEILLSDKLFLETTSPYYQAAYLNFVSPVLANNWKGKPISRNVLSRLESNLSHTYQNVRFAISNLLNGLFTFKIGIHSPENEDRINFCGRIESQLNQTLSSLFAQKDSDVANNMALVKSGIFDIDSTEGKQLLHMVETLCHWITYSLNSKTLTSVTDFVNLFSFLCLVQSSNPTVQSNVHKAITKIASQIYKPEHIDSVLGLVEKVSQNWNWHSRKQVIIFIQRFTYSNIFILAQNEKWLNALLQIVTDLLQDEVVEVRESACLTLSSFIIWNVISEQRMQSLIADFKVGALHKIKKTRTEDGQRCSNLNDLRIKHAGILGLCAFVYACPDDLPDHLPDILLFLTEHLSEPSISKSTRTALNSFKRFHLSNWVEFKQKFTPDQLSELNNILISPSYYA